jgi:uncharacterized membrane protein
MRSTKNTVPLDQSRSILWAILAVVVAIILLFFIGEGGLNFLLGKKLGEALSMILYVLILGGSSFLICRRYTKSVWYVVLILNLFSILSIIGEYPNLTIVTYNGLAILLSIAGGIWGARTGNRRILLKQE